MNNSLRNSQSKLNQVRRLTGGYAEGFSRVQWLRWLLIDRLTTPIRSCEPENHLCTRFHWPRKFPHTPRQRRHLCASRQIRWRSHVNKRQQSLFPEQRALPDAKKLGKCLNKMRNEDGYKVMRSTVSVMLGTLLDEWPTTAKHRKGNVTKRIFGSLVLLVNYVNGSRYFLVISFTFYRFYGCNHLTISPTFGIIGKSTSVKKKLSDWKFYSSFIISS